MTDLETHKIEEDDRRHERAWRILLLLPLGTVAVATERLARLTAREARAAVRGHPAPTRGSDLALLLLAAGLVAAFAWWRLRRRSAQAGIWLPVGALGAGIAAVLGAAAYAPCAQPGSAAFTVTGWVLELFVGNIEGSGAGATCAEAFPAGFSLARTLALAVTVLSAVGVVLTLARQQVDRWRVTLSGDVDVVVGLDAMSLRLVQVLAAEHGAGQDNDPWVDRRPGFLHRGRVRARGPGWLIWWLTGLRPGDLARLVGRAPETVVVESDPRNPFLEASRRAGAIVVVGEATDPRLLRSVLTRRTWRGRRRTALRRLFAVDGDQSRNIAVFRVAEERLREATLQRHLRHLVPRLFIRMNDAREARQWRAAQTQHLGAGGSGRAAQRDPALVSDSLAVEEIAAQRLAHGIVESAVRDEERVQQVVLLGEGDLSLTLLDEVAWQLWCRHESTLAEAAVSGPSAARPVPVSVRITLAGPNADRRCHEWHDLRAPWQAPVAHGGADGAVLKDVAPEVISGGADGEEIAAQVLRQDADAMVIVVGDGAADCAAAARLARRFPAAPDRLRVVLHSGTPGPVGAVVAGGLHHSSPSLVRWEDKRDHPPHDSVTRMARQQHEVYLAGLQPPTVEAIDAAQKDPGKRLTRVGWTDLPAFFQEDNVRQHWEVVTRFDWRPVYRNDPAADALRWWPGDLTDLAEAEYQRWAGLRRDRGWWAADERHDAHRLHPDLEGWEACDHDFNRQQVRSILERLWASGLTPVPRARQGRAPGPSVTGA
jgi:hypothetical protein